MGLADELEAAFKTTDLYAILKTDKTATASQIKSAYYKTALKLHPDRASKEKKDEATALFQLLGKAYAVLSDPERRKVYDDCGELDDEAVFGGGDMDRDWTEYWRAMFKKVTVKDIEHFAKVYRHSDEERNDLKQAYVDAQGDMDIIMESVMCATHDDEPRFRAALKELIKSGDVEPYDAFVKESKAKRAKRKRQAEEEAHEAEAAARELGLKRGKDSNDENDNLAALIHARQKARAGALDDMVAAMEAKYGAQAKGKAKGGKPKGKKGTEGPAGEPSEEEFRAAQARVDAGRKKHKARS